MHWMQNWHVSVAIAISKWKNILVRAHIIDNRYKYYFCSKWYQMFVTDTESWLRFVVIGW